MCVPAVTCNASSKQLPMLFLEQPPCVALNVPQTLFLGFSNLDLQVTQTETRAASGLPKATAGGDYSGSLGFLTPSPNLLCARLLPGTTGRVGGESTELLSVHNPEGEFICQDSHWPDPVKEDVEGCCSSSIGCTLHDALRAVDDVKVVERMTF